MTYRQSLGLGLAGLLTGWMLIGCSSNARPVGATSQSSWSVTHHYHATAGLLRPPLVDVNVWDVNDGVGLEVSVLALPAMPDRLLSPAAAYTRTMTLSPNAQFVTPVLKVSEGARIGRVPDARTLIRRIQMAGYGRATLLDQTAGVLPVAVAWDTRVTEPHTRESLMLQVVRQRPPVADTNVGGVLGLVLSHRVRDGSASTTERLLLRHGLLVESPGWAVMMPCHHPGPQFKALALVCRLLPDQKGDGDPNATKAALAQCREKVRKELHQQASQGPTNQIFQQLQQALPLLRWPARQRRSLHYITRQSPFAHEMAMAAPRPLIRDLAQAVIKAFDQDQFPPTHVPWTLEKLAYGVVLQSWEDGELNPAVQALLTIHTGQVGCDLTTLRSVLQQSTNFQTFENQLKQENTIYLQDISPSARVRAYQWLVDHTAAPAGYDPLASAQQRRAALAAVPATPLSSSQEPTLEKDVH